MYLIALNSVLMKSLERIVLSLFLPRVQPHLDPHQFAYRSKRGVEDAIVLFTHNIYKHLDKPKAYVRTMFIDFSSAFNTIQPHLLIPKLRDYGVCETISAWIFEFLNTRPQFVTVKTDSNCYKSDIIVTNTGAPQGASCRLCCFQSIQMTVNHKAPTHLTSSMRMTPALLAL